MAWIYLILAGVMEVGWPLGLKYANGENGFRWVPAMLAAFFMGLSGFMLYLAQREIPMGTAYAVWTGIGSVGTFVLGIILFNEPAQIARCICVGMIAFGIVGLKLFSK